MGAVRLYSRAPGHIQRIDVDVRAGGRRAFRPGPLDLHGVRPTGSVPVSHTFCCQRTLAL